MLGERTKVSDAEIPPRKSFFFPNRPNLMQSESALHASPLSHHGWWYIHFYSLGCTYQGCAVQDPVPSHRTKLHQKVEPLLTGTSMGTTFSLWPLCWNAKKETALFPYSRTILNCLPFLERTLKFCSLFKILVVTLAFYYFIIGHHKLVVTIF